MYPVVEVGARPIEPLYSRSRSPHCVVMFTFFGLRCECLDGGCFEALGDAFNLHSTTLQMAATGIRSLCQPSGSGLQATALKRDKGCSRRLHAWSGELKAPSQPKKLGQSSAASQPKLKGTNFNSATHAVLTFFLFNVRNITAELVLPKATIIRLNSHFSKIQYQAKRTSFLAGKSRRETATRLSVLAPKPYRLTNRLHNIDIADAKDQELCAELAERASSGPQAVRGSCRRQQAPRSPSLCEEEAATRSTTHDSSERNRDLCGGREANTMGRSRVSQRVLGD